MKNFLPTTKFSTIAAIGVFLPALLIYLIMSLKLEFPEYFPFQNALNITIRKNTDIKISKRRVLAEPSTLPEIPLENTTLAFHLYSAVPVRSQDTFAGASLAIIGRSVYHDTTCVTANDTYGNHFVQYNDHSTRKIFQVRKTTKLAYYGGETVWYAEMPEEIAERMFNPLSTQACAKITVLMGHNEKMAKAVAEMETCHNPSVLPQPGHKVDAAYCVNTPPVSDFEEGKLSVGMSFSVPNILYHLHSGVDLFVIYIPFSVRETYLRLLEPIIEKYSNRLLFVDLSSEWAGIKFNRGQEKFNYALPGPLSQDCLNRMKGHSRYLRTLEFDEYDMTFTHSRNDPFHTPKPLAFMSSKALQEKNVLSAWNDEKDARSHITYAIRKLKPKDPTLESKKTFQAPHIENQVFDCLELNHFWFLREGTGLDKILPNTALYIPLTVPAYGKSLCRPERIAVMWVHLPTNCFGRHCKILQANLQDDHNATSSKEASNKTELGYAHIRWKEWPYHKEFKEKQIEDGHLINTSIFKEVRRKLEDEIMDLYGTAVPGDLLPLNSSSIIV